MVNNASYDALSGMIVSSKVIIWDNDGTITGSLNPHDERAEAKVILPGVENKMRQAKFNFVISGFKSPESETQDFDPLPIIDKFMNLMNKLPIYAVAFSPRMGGIACYVMVKKGNKISIIKAHEQPEYRLYIGKFKKPDTGMFHVIADRALRDFGIQINAQNTLMIGDTWHDKSAAASFGIPFVDAKVIHFDSRD